MSDFLIGKVALWKDFELFKKRAKAYPFFQEPSLYRLHKDYLEFKKTNEDITSEEEAFGAFVDFYVYCHQEETVEIKVERGMAAPNAWMRNVLNSVEDIIDLSNSDDDGEHSSAFLLTTTTELASSTNNVEER